MTRTSGYIPSVVNERIVSLQGVLVALQDDGRNKSTSTRVDGVALCISVTQKVHAGLGRTALGVANAGREPVVR
jgi:hypothetical protein